MFNHILLLFAAMIWGGAFIFQKMAMEVIDPYFFSSLRFLIGSFTLLPIILFVNRKKFIRFPNREKGDRGGIDVPSFKKIFFSRPMIQGGMVAGFIIAIGVNLQQVALNYTQVAKVGFITSFYIIIVPLIEVFQGKKLSIRIFLACLVAIVGFFLISFKGSMYKFDFGDVLTLISALFWAWHIVYVGSRSKNLDNFVFSFTQFFFCGFFTLIFVIISGIDISLAPIKAAWVEILYGGMISVGIGYTLQVFGQKRVEPHLAALVFSLEAVFAAIFEMLILRTFLTPTETVGGLLLFAAVVYSQLTRKKPSIEIIN